MRRGIAILFVLLGACRGERAVVLAPPEPPMPPPPISTCEEALDVGMEGDDCEGLEMGCIRDTGCCFEHVFCELGHLVRFEDCGGCVDCTIDRDCGPGLWCLPGGLCAPCPPPEDCPPCPDGLTPLVRNECPTCECVPPSECEIDEECGDPMLYQCAIGAFCVCEDPGCCTNTCAPRDCSPPEPPPEGCVVPCDDPACPGFCRNIGCRCEADAWVCDVECAFDAMPDCGL
ncbi:MAG: hypothetical protein KC619_07905 [Myxococcales bacterium]|nr:hypothetical protein [Myxococcales bacterium]